jgi:hypothetical protein
LREDLIRQLYSEEAVDFLISIFKPAEERPSAEELL